jgi:hypothetical protein
MWWWLVDARWWCAETGKKNPLYGGAWICLSVFGSAPMALAGTINAPFAQLDNFKFFRYVVTHF